MPTAAVHVTTRLLLALSTLLALCAFVALPGITLFETYRSAERSTVDRAGTIATSLERHLGRLFEATDNALLAAIGATAIPGIEDVSPAIRLTALFGAMPLDGVDGLAITDASGAVTNGIGQSVNRPAIIAAHPNFIALKSRADAGLAVSAPYFSTGSQEWFVMLLRRINTQDGTFAGVAMGSVAVGPLRNYFKGLAAGPGSVVSLFGADMHVLSQWPGTDAEYGQVIANPQFAADMLYGGAAKPHSVRDPDGHERFYAFRQISNLPLVVGVGISSQVARSTWWAAAGPTLWILGIAILFLVGLTLAIRQEWARRLAAEREAKQAAAELSMTNARLQALFQHSPDALQVVQVDADGTLSWEAVSPVFLQLYDIRRSSLHGLTPDACLPPDVAKHLLSCWQSCVAARKPLTFQHAVEDGPLRREVEQLIAPIFDDAGNIRRLCGSIRDVTARNQVEHKLRHAQRMDIVGQLTAGVANDFNNILQSIIGTLDVLEQHVTLHNESAQCLSIVRRAAFRGAALTNRLLTISRKQDLDPALLDLTEAFAELKELCDSTLGPRVDVEMSLAPMTWPILVDASQLTSCIVNLAVNARDAMPGGGRITIAARNGHSDDPGAPPLSPGDYAVIRVVDDGFGMKPDTLARACDPFFSTKEVGKGSGLGLPMVQGFAAQSGGAMTITSAFGHGAAVEIWLPRATETLVPAAERPPHARGLAGRVLVVDDDDEVRTALAMMLAQGGHTVVGANDADTAMDRMASDGRFDVLLSDYAMPGISGAQLIHRALEADPSLGVLLITGYDQRALAATEVPPGVRILRKPVRRDELLMQVQAVMDAGSSGAPAAGPAAAAQNIVPFTPRLVV